MSDAHAWADDFARALTLAQLAPRRADLARITALLADKPDAGLGVAWWDLVEAAAAWVERCERAPLPRLDARPVLDRALADPPQRRHAWQERADA